MDGIIVRIEKKRICMIFFFKVTRPCMTSYKSLPRNVRVKSQPDFSTLPTSKKHQVHRKTRKSVSPSCIRTLSGKILID